MFDGLRARWNAARQRRFQGRVAKYLRTHFSEVMGSDERFFVKSGAIDALHRKYFGE